MSDKPKDDEQVPGGDLSGNEDGASSDGDSGHGGAGGKSSSGSGGKGGSAGQDD
jgi:hypothetical protein